MKLKHLTISALALILIAGCGDDDGVGVEPDDIAGTWTATSMLFTQVAAPNATVDIVVDDVAELVIVFGSNGSYTFTFVFPPDPTEDEIEIGTFTVSGDTMTITPTGGTAESFTIDRDGDTMTLTDDDDYDFGSGTDELATLVITLTR